MQIVKVKKVKHFSEKEKIWDIRKKVFVEEQGVDQALEYEFEEESQHFIAFVDDHPAGTARWRFTGKGVKLERFAVLPQYRKMGVAKALLKAVLSDIPPGKHIYLHSQESAVGLYETNGFEIEGEAFNEAGIVHYKMIYIRV